MEVTFVVAALLGGGSRRVAGRFLPAVRAQAQPAPANPSQPIPARFPVVALPVMRHDTCTGSLYYSTILLFYYSTILPLDHHRLYYRSRWCCTLQP